MSTTKSEKRKAMRKQEWLNRFLEYKAFREKNPNKWEVEKEADGSHSPLSKWVYTQRSRHATKTNNVPSLTDEEIKLLESVDFRWSCTVNDVTWTINFNEMMEYKEKHGNFRVPRRYKQNAISLGGWVSTQRSHMQKGTLKPDRKAKLDAINFDFAPGGTEQREAAWNENFEKIKFALKANSNAALGFTRRGNFKRAVKIGSTLSHWTVIQKQRRAQGVLSQEKIDRLDAIGFSWDTRTADSESSLAKWDTRYREMEAFYKKHGHCKPVPSVSAANKRLDRWVVRQRMRKKGSCNEQLPMPQYQIDRLDKIEFEWVALNLDEIWEDRVEKLLAYEQKHGDMLVPSNFQEDFTLGKWVATQRRLRKSGILRKDREARLAEIGFEWEGSKRDTNPERSDAFWRKNYLKLHRFRQEHGHCLVPRSARLIDDTSFSWWVGSQRRLYKNGTLPDMHRDLLEEIGFVWEAPRNGRLSPFPEDWDEEPPRRKSEDINYSEINHDSRHPTQCSSESSPRGVAPSNRPKGKKPSQYPNRPTRKRKRVDYAEEDAQNNYHEDLDHHAGLDDLGEEGEYEGYTDENDEDLDVDFDDDDDDSSDEFDYTCEELNNGSNAFALSGKGRPLVAHSLETEKITVPSTPSDATTRGNPVGRRRVSVYWEGDDKYYEGVVTRKGEGNLYFVAYDDGESEWTELGPKDKFLEEQQSKREDNILGGSTNNQEPVLVGSAAKKPRLIEHMFASDDEDATLSNQGIAV